MGKKHVPDHGEYEAMVSMDGAHNSIGRVCGALIFVAGMCAGCHEPVAGKVAGTYLSEYENDHDELQLRPDGTYRHVLGTDKDYHAICVVGYDDYNQCWIAKNSWGDAFGEAGFFRIGYGECEVEDFPFHAVDVSPWP